VAQGWLVLTLTNNSAFWLGVVGFAGAIPFLFFTLFGGVIADRVNKRRLLLFTQSTMMLLAFLLAGLAYSKVITVWEVVLLAFLSGVVMSMNQPSYQALVPQLVQREDLTNAIALNSVQYNMSRILGPTLGGYAMALMGVAGNFFLNGLSFLGVLFALIRIRYPKEKPARRESMLTSLRGGLGYVHSRPQMFALVGMIAVSSLLTMPFMVFIPYFARVQLHTDASGMGWLFGASGLGSVLGALTVASLGHHLQRSGRDGGGGGLLLHTQLCAVGLPHAAGGWRHDAGHHFSEYGHADPVQRRDARAGDEHLWNLLPGTAAGGRAAGRRVIAAHLHVACAGDDVRLLLAGVRGLLRLLQSPA
jgi:MFS family permease